MTRWNNEQERAIEGRGKSILVAAAAGSGKTAVLVERIRRLVVEEGVSVRSILVVTFTNAAASEMKEKIRLSLSAEAEKARKTSKSSYDYLKRQLEMLPQAEICTFHAFALNVIRRSFYRLDIEPNFSVCDSAKSILMKEDALDELTEREFEKPDADFVSFLNCYSSDRNMNRVREMILGAYERLMAMPHPWEWFDAQSKILEADNDSFYDSGMWKLLTEEIRFTLSEALGYEKDAEQLLLTCGLDRMADIIAKEEREPIGSAINMLSGECGDPPAIFDKLREILKGKSPTLRAKKEEQAGYETVKADVKLYRELAKKKTGDLVSMFFALPLEEQLDDMRETAKHIRTLERLIKAFAELYREAKKDQRLIDFSDIEHYCLEILEQDDEADRYRERFEHIFIDEYQDTNGLQEAIIDRIKRENNMFMVGDIKQSIYGFRLAEPSIFKGKYELYSKPETAESEVIDLNRNYRSKAPILQYINEIFEPLMEGYDERAMLYPGLEYDGDCLYTPEAHIVSETGAEESEPADEAIAELEKAEKEALYVARLIKENLGREYYDSKLGEKKTISRRDIVILLRGVRGTASAYYEVLNREGITACIDDNEGYFDTIEIDIMMNLLSVIDNRKQDIPLISVLHSEIFGFSAAELGRIRAEFKDGSFSDAFSQYCVSGSLEDMRAKCGSAAKKLDAWREKAALLPLSQFIWGILLESHYYVISGAMPGGVQHQANLRALVEKADKYSENRQASLYGFVKYIDAVKKRNVKIPQVKLISEQDDVVRIMSIHKSKGLEFPMVIVSGLGKKLVYSSRRSKFALHRDVGIGLSRSDYKGHWERLTIPQKLIALKFHKEEYEEEVRILYVALTRARDMLFLIGTVKDGEKFEEKVNRSVRGETTYLDMLAPGMKYKMIQVSELSAPAGSGVSADFDDIKCEITDDEKSELDERLRFRYGYERSRKLKSKYSVSELNRINATESVEEARVKLCDALEVPKFKSEGRHVTAAERGTAYHTVMKRLDFAKAFDEGEAYIMKVSSELEAKGLIEAGIIDERAIREINAFFGTDVGRRASKASAEGRLKKEKPFTLMRNEGGENILIQGIIDCYFTEGDKCVLIDYKSNMIAGRRGEELIEKTYRKQIEAYASALKEAAVGQVDEAYLYLFSKEKTVRIELEKH